jgi:hypothetical protein
MRGDREAGDRDGDAWHARCSWRITVSTGLSTNFLAHAIVTAGFLMAEK